MPYSPPVGIPNPIWPDVGSPIDAVRPSPPSPWTSDQAGYYYIEPTFPGATNSGRTYGNPTAPRATIPQSVPAGSKVFIHGVYAGDHRGSPLTVSGTSTAPVWITSFNTGNRCTATRQWSILNSSYLIIDSIDWDWRGYTYAKMEFSIPDHVCLRNGTTLGNGTVDGTDGTDAYNMASCGVFGAGNNMVIYNMDFTKSGNWLFASGDPDAHITSLSGGFEDFWLLDCELSYSSGCAFQVIDGTTTPDDEVCKRVYVGRNLCHHMGQTALWTKRGDTVVFSQNVCHTMRRDSPSNANSGGIGAQYGPRNLWIILNTVYNCQSGIQIGSNSIGAPLTTTPIYIVGNLFYDIHNENIAMPDDWRTNTSCGAGVCMVIWGGTHTHIVNNTCDDYDAGVISTIDAYNKIIEGNIFTNGNPLGALAHFPADPGGLNVFDRNIVEEQSGAIWYKCGDSGSIKTTVAALNAVKGPNNSATAPTYIDQPNRDYNLDTGSNGIDDFGSTAHAVYDLFETNYGLGINYDINTGARPSNTNWDIGAFEYGSSPDTPSVPANVVPPSISGTTNRDETLTAALGTWTGYPTRSYTYQWVRCDSAGLNPADIASATSSTYVLVQDDVGNTIKVRVTATNTEGSASATSAATAVIGNQIVDPPTFSAEKHITFEEP